jgi:hypothetical protein
MATRIRYRIDPSDPRAPSREIWEALSPQARQKVVDELPEEAPLEWSPPEGDYHRTAKARVLDALGGFLRRTGRRVYLSSELSVYYPGEPRLLRKSLVSVSVVRTV